MKATGTGGDNYSSERIGLRIPIMLEPEIMDDIRPTIVTDYDDEDDDPPVRGEIINGKLYKPGMFRPGQIANPKGRPKGKTLKEWCRDYLTKLTDEEREVFLAGIPKEIIWRLAEGNPTEDRNVSITVPKPILGGMTQGNQATMVEEQSMNTLPEGQNIENKP